MGQNPHPGNMWGWTNVLQTLIMCDQNPYPGDIMYDQIPYTGDRPYEQIPVCSPSPPRALQW